MLRSGSCLTGNVESSNPVPLALTSPLSLRAKVSTEQGNFTVSLYALLMLSLTLAATAIDQYAAPVLYTTSPLWAVALCEVLVWRRAGFGVPSSTSSETFGFGFPRVALFGIAHVLLVVAATCFRQPITPIAGTVSGAGWILAALKLMVLAPILLLLPLRRWRILLKTYRAEFAAASFVLFTFFPARILAATWAWYGQVLGRFVFAIAGLFVPGLSYSHSLNPTIYAPDLDVTILPACSGISGIELFDCLFAFVAIMDWNRLRKGRAMSAYFAGIAAMLLGNALRLVSLVVLGNRGFANVIARFHISAGWLFFSVVFLVYLAAVYRFLLTKPVASLSQA
jgi:exosortase/archaeosortase family protein